MRFLLILFSIFLFGYEVKWIKAEDGCYIAFPYLLINKSVKKIEYSGKCKNNKVYGNKAKIIFSDGKVARFIGKIKDGYFEGLGEFKFDDGSFFAGIWDKSYLKGEFNFKLKSGGYYQCSFNGKLICQGAAANFGKSRQAALARWMGDYIKDVVKSTKEMLTSTPKSDSSVNGNIRLEYSGYTDWNKHYTYNIYVNGEYDGQIFYYWDKDKYIFMTIGTSRSIDGDYYPDLSYDNFYTPTCGEGTASSINEAIKKAVNCAYKGYY